MSTPININITCDGDFVFDENGKEKVEVPEEEDEEVFVFE